MSYSQLSLLRFASNGPTHEIGEIMASLDELPPLVPDIKVRAVTRFLCLGPDCSQWPLALSSAAGLCASLAATFRSLGYETQTLRLVTNPFGEYLDCSSTEAALEGLAELKAILGADTSGLRIRFAIGAAVTRQELALVPKLIGAFGDLANVCVNVGCDANGVVDAEMVEACAQTVEELAACTPRGEGNFNFTVNFNCPQFIPYFPAGFHNGKGGECFAIGLEHVDLIARVLEPLDLGSVPAAGRAAAWAAAGDALKVAMEEHTTVLAAAANACAAVTGVRFVGLDSSAAPSKVKCLSKHRPRCSPSLERGC
jgi:uncharacterized protein (UPF0210 family)